MKKRGSISIYVLIILLCFGLAISFVYEQNRTTASITRMLYDKKVATYKAESLVNIILFDGRVEDDNLKNIYKDFGYESIEYDGKKKYLNVTFKENDSQAGCTVYLEKTDEGAYNIIKKNIY